MTHAKEIFKEIDFYTNYEVSNLGRVRNSNTGRILSQSILNSGYFKVVLHKNGAPRNITVHRLVATTFLGENKGLIINHKNGDKLDNHLTNLEFCTYSENALHAIALGLRVPFRKRITVFENGIYSKTFDSLTEAAEHLGISASWASRLIARKKDYKKFKMVFAG